MRGRRLIRAVVPLAFLLAIVIVGAIRLLPHGSSAVTPSSEAPAARYAGTLTRVSFAGWPSPNPTSSNPYAYVNNGNPTYTGLLADVPIGVDDHGHFFPDLAAQVPSSTNGGLKVVGGDTVATVHLKPGLRWSDGSPITPADYLAPLLFGLSPDYQPGCPYRAARATGHDLIVTFPGIVPYALVCLPAPLPLEYFQRKYGIHIAADLTASLDAGRITAMYADPSYKGSALQALITKLVNDPYTSPHDLFSGPFLPVSWPNGGPYVLAPNPYYTALPPDPHHRRPARIRLVTTPGTLGNAQLTAQLGDPHVASADMAILVNANEASAAPIREFDVHILQNGAEILVLNQASAPLRDRRIRQALLYGIDKIAYIRDMFQVSAAGVAALALTSPMPAYMPWSIDAEFPRSFYDPAEARRLLAAAGYASAPGAAGRHLQLDLTTTPWPNRVRSGRILQRMWGRLGITIRLQFPNQRADGGLFSSYANGGILQRRRFDIAEYALGEFLDPNTWYPSLDPGQIPDQNHPGGTNVAGIRDRAVFTPLAEAQRILDDERRQRLYEQFQRAMVEQAYYIPLYGTPWSVAVKHTIGNFKPYDFNYPYWNAYEWYAR